MISLSGRQGIQRIRKKLAHCIILTKQLLNCLFVFIFKRISGPGSMTNKFRLHSKMAWIRPTCFSPVTTLSQAACTTVSRWWCGTSSQPAATGRTVSSTGSPRHSTSGRSAGRDREPPPPLVNEKNAFFLKFRVGTSSVKPIMKRVLGFCFEVYYNLKPKPSENKLAT